MMFPEADLQEYLDSEMIADEAGLAVARIAIGEDIPFDEELSKLRKGLYAMGGSHMQVCVLARHFRAAWDLAEQGL